jgi:nitroreductase
MEKLLKREKTTCSQTSSRGLYSQDFMNDMDIVSQISEIISNRRSIRQFLDQPVSNKVLHQILEIGSRAPFAAQLCSVIYTRNREKMLEAGIWTYPTSKVHLIYFIDILRLEKIMAKKGHEYGYDDMMTIWLGIQDVSLAVENMVIAAETVGLGSVLYGIAPLKADDIAKVFNVPQRVFPVIGMSIGYPDPTENTEKRPRFPLRMTASEDRYQHHSKEDIDICMKIMDEGYIEQGYYSKSKTKIPLVDKEDNIDFDKYSWSEHISRKFRKAFRNGEPLLEILRRHGFDL